MTTTQDHNDTRADLVARGLTPSDVGKAMQAILTAKARLMVIGGNDTQAMQHLVKAVDALNNAYMQLQDIKAMMQDQENPKFETGAH